MKKWISFGCSLVVALLVPLSASAQQTAVPLGTSGAPYGYYEYLPDGYSSTSGEWPVVVFLHGMGETGRSFAWMRTSSPCPPAIRRSERKSEARG